MNATVDLLLNTEASDAEATALRVILCRAGLLWRCDPCDWYVAGGTACDLCQAAPPADTPPPPAFVVVPVLCAGTTIPVAVYDRVEDATALTARLNTRHDTPLAAVGSAIPRNPLPIPTLLDHSSPIRPSGGGDA